MQTNFTLAQLGDSDTAESEKILRTCVHCGFCTATCPTYLLLGDELDGPRGRIYLIKDMLEGGKPASATVVRHIDRCLSCLSCMTTCPSGVNYMHLVDHARRHIAETFRRPWRDRMLRRMLAVTLPNRRLFTWSLTLSRLARPLARFLPGRLAPMLALAPRKRARSSPMDRPQVFPAPDARRMRVALLSGCVQPVLKPAINEATIRLLTRHGVEVVVSARAGCCGSLTHHLGEEAPAVKSAKANIAAWWREIEGKGLDAIVINASGCGTMVKDYGFLLRNDPLWAEKAARVSALARDITEVMAELGLLPSVLRTRPVVAYHSACSMQHGQKVIEQPKKLLRDAGFIVKDVPEGHICCGWAGTYQVLQPELSRRLRDRKVANIESVRPDVIAAGNFGCIGNIAAGTGIPIAHTVDLLDWATGGPKPVALP
jgi:glycolate oxidase iron-sulfur subunit